MGVMMKYLIVLLLVLSQISVASPFAELNDTELLPANDGFYSCYIYDNKANPEGEYKIIGSMNRDGLYFNKQHFKKISRVDLLELGENKAKTAIYGNTKINLNFYRTKKATFNEGIRHYPVKLTYKTSNLTAKNYYFTVKCGA